MNQGIQLALKEEPQCSSERQITLLHRVISEGIRQSQQSANQAHWSFIIASIMSTAGAIIGLSGAGLMLFDLASEGSVTTAVGLASGMYSYQFSKEAADRQKQANERLEQLLLELHAEG